MNNELNTSQTQILKRNIKHKFSVQLLNTTEKKNKNRHTKYACYVVSLKLGKEHFPQDPFLRSLSHK